MSYRWLQRLVGGAVVYDEPTQRPDAGATWRLLSPGGSELATGSCTRDAVATTLSAGAAQGALSLAVTSATGIGVGRAYLLEDEWVTVAAISGTTITLARPLLKSHAVAAAFVSTRLTAQIPGASCTTIYRSCVLWITYAVGAVAQPAVSLELDITRYSLLSGLTLETVRDLDPLIVKRASAGTVWPAVIAAAWERIVASIGLQKSPGGLVGALDLTQPHAIAVQLLVAQQSSGEDARATALDLAARLDALLAAILTSRAFDDDQDGAIESREGFYRTIQITRG